jgi:hypothetical protein
LVAASALVDAAKNFWMAQRLSGLGCWDAAKIIFMLKDYRLAGSLK